MATHSRKAVVVGGGPVGCLSAMALARMGWDVEIYEGRPDLRLPSSKTLSQQRSINLAISSRGIAALQAIDPAATERFIQTVIPMRGRMIHDKQGKLDSQLYDMDGQCINSVDRALLNEGLLDEASAILNIELFFKHKVQAVDFDQRVITIRDVEADKDVRVNFDFCIGADGSYSVVRRQLMRIVRMDYHQEYIPHEYLELKMPAGTDANGKPTFLLDPNHLHIWPRHSFMLIALPNKDKSFTCTLFAPTADFERLRSREAILTWFKIQFPDALSLIGAEMILECFAKNPRSSLISTKLKPYHYKDRAVLLGDAAHSMVPFYGQGLNCGLEDVRVLDTLLRDENVNPRAAESDPARDNAFDIRLANALSRYSSGRHEDLVAICDLAMDNFVEMRHSVTTPAYVLRKMFDDVLYSLCSTNHMSVATLGPLLSRIPFSVHEPSGWIPLYTMVTFRPDISYAMVKKKAQRQSHIVSSIGWVGTAFFGITFLGITWVALSRRLRSQGGA